MAPLFLVILFRRPIVSGAFCMVTKRKQSTSSDIRVEDAESCSLEVLSVLPDVRKVDYIIRSARREAPAV
jgi:hypothetical protein